MKTILSNLIFSALILSASTVIGQNSEVTNQKEPLGRNVTTPKTPSSAQASQSNQGGEFRGRRANFIDSDKDGICDNYSGSTGVGRGANYTDLDNDGVCDHRKDRRFGHGVKNRSHKGQRNFRNRETGHNYIDENKDGQCDNYEQSKRGIPTK